MRPGHRAASVLLAPIMLAIVASAPNLAAAELPACDPVLLVREQAELSNASPLAVLLAAGRRAAAPPPGVALDRWPAVQAAAVAWLGGYVAACDIHQELGRLSGFQFAAHFDPYGPKLPDVVATYVESGQSTIPVLSQVAGAPGGIPLPQRLQVGLSQVVSAGQPGFAANLAGAVSRTGDNRFLRHSSLTGSLLLMQPISTGGATTALMNTQLASTEIAWAYSGRRTAYDWSKEIADNQQANTLKHLERAAVLATQQLLRGYQIAKSAGRSDDEALTAGVDNASRLYSQAVEGYWVDNFIAPEVKRAAHPFHLDLALRARLTPRPEYLPELPDMLSVGLDSFLEGGMVGGRAQGRLLYNLGARASYSAYPTRVCVRFDACAARGNFLADASGGLAVDLPAPDNAPVTTFRASGVFRWGPRHDMITTGEVPEISGGFSAALNVPLSPTIALLGTYTLRWTRGLGRYSTSGLTLAKAM